MLDSLVLLGVIGFPDSCDVVDVGSGAGFPGVPIKIARCDLRVTLIEASRRRVAFLEHVRNTLALNDLRIEWGRAEILAHQQGFREAFTMAVERAVARLAVSVELCLPLLRVGGQAVLLKGLTVFGEVRSAEPLIDVLGGSVERLTRRVLPHSEHESVVLVLRKQNPTPAGYPRAAKRLGRPP